MHDDEFSSGTLHARLNEWGEIIILVNDNDGRVNLQPDDAAAFAEWIQDHLPDEI